jgi:cell division protein FtsZ
LEEATIEGAKGVLIHVTGGPDLTLHEINEASSIIREAADDDANIIFGAVIDETMSNAMKVTIIATGFNRTAVGESRSTPFVSPYALPRSVIVPQRILRKEPMSPSRIKESKRPGNS